MTEPKPGDRIYIAWNLANNSWVYPEERNRYRKHLLNSPTDSDIANTQKEIQEMIDRRFAAWDLGN